MRLLARMVIAGIFLFVCVAATQASLAIKINEPKTPGSKVIVKLELQSTYSQKIESVRAAIFLMDDQGKVVGQDTRWIIGGTKDKPALAPGAKTTYNFVIATDKPFTKTKLVVTRIVLEGGKLGNALTDVQIQDAPK